MVRALLFSSLLASTAAYAPRGQFTRAARGLSALSIDIDAKIGGNDIVVFSKSTCPFCSRTKALFEGMDLKADIIELDQLSDGPAVQAELLAKTGQKTVPSVFIRGKHLGGNDDTQKAAKDGSLTTMLAAGK